MGDDKGGTPDWEGVSVFVSIYMIVSPLPSRPIPGTLPPFTIDRFPNDRLFDRARESCSPSTWDRETSREGGKGFGVFGPSSVPMVSIF